MKKIATLIACLMPLFAVAQQQADAPDATAPAIANRSVPASAVDADGAYIDYKAVLSDGKSSINLGEYPRASECLHRLELASTSPEFNQAIQQRPILYLTCVVLRKKA
ncbi:hypothetical protein [Ralstonia insidiosa]|nr:hypothetical protein [Ralstonia insidiosa]MBA9939884.1 hypothetical protein [Ralstonia insidiosa]MBC9968546.1 hypothetical protein [Ralstonia insidiosa]MBX3904633.1 hypothetical protein [Ralstonia insidiosa]